MKRNFARFVQSDFQFYIYAMNSEESLHFRDIEPADRSVVGDFLRRHPTRRQNYCFQVLYLWEEACEFQIEFYRDLLLVKTYIDCRHNFLYPIGDGDVVEAIEKMIRYAEARDCPFRLFQIPESGKKMLEERFPGRFVFGTERGESEYIYSAEKLATLAGSKLQHKRNHINYFEQNFRWSFEPLTAANLDECRDFNRRWFGMQREAGDLGSMLLSEQAAIEKAFAEWDTLGLDGALLCADGEVAAYSAGCPLAGDTYLVLFEKSLHQIRGASQQINRLFVQEYAKDYKWVNRGEDNGDEGLRQAKLSYHPDILEDIYSAKIL